jgi:uncharacterized protein
LPAHVLPIAFGALLIVPGIGAGPANAQSFPCRSAHYADEKTVCNDAGLGQLDQDLAAVYRRVMLKLPRREAEDLDKNEDTFVLARRRCGDNRACIEQSYRNRIQELQSALPEAETDRKAERRAQSKGSDRQQASTRDRGTTDDRRGEASDTNRASPEAVVSSPVRPSDQGEAKAAPGLPPPTPPTETRARRDGAASVVPNPPSRREAEAALEGVPPRDKHSRHTRRTESAASAPAATDHDKQPTENGAAVAERHPAATSATTAAPERHRATSESTSAPERRAATSGSTVAPEPAPPPEKRHAKAKTAAASTPSPPPSPGDQAKPASQPEIKWVNPAPSQ